MEFPRLVYRSASNHMLVEDEAQHKQALKDGWFDSVPETTGEAKAVVEQAKADVKDAQVKEAAAAKAQAVAQAAADQANVASKAAAAKDAKKKK